MGFDKEKEKTEMVTLIQQTGAVYRPALQYSETTHLICFK